MRLGVEQLLRNVAAVGARVFGEEHGRTLLVHDSIGTVLHKMGRPTASVAARERACWRAVNISLSGRNRARP